MRNRWAKGALALVFFAAMGVAAGTANAYGFGFGHAKGSIADVLGIPAEELQAEFQQGKSLVDIAKAHGIDEATLIDRLVAAKKEALDRLVQSGKIDQARADALLEQYKSDLPQRIEKAPSEAGKPFSRGKDDSPFKRGFDRGGFGPHGFGPHASIADLADILGLQPDELQNELKNGKSLAQIAEAHGIAKADLIARLTDAVKQTLDERVQAGKMTQEQADQALAKFKQRVETMVDRVPPLHDGKRGERPKPKAGQEA
ncbi:MAG: hypothetical protein KM312_12865 [Hydrogenibacillus schlegelii]|uniref:Uncharacterized protein n=1 Tax=Hydrogenibacillus schlegelii TaxID=1484 RepID=A0A947CZA6_HYDSH|nr:hypothetical protein [Hydrogenibacillus schlegelii]